MHGRAEAKAKWLVLYAVTVAIEVPVMLARYVAGLAVAAVLLHMSGHADGNAAEWAKLVAVGPVAWSALALVSPKGGGWWWRHRMGGREPSEREREVYRDALEALRARTTMPLPSPESWFVLDDPSCDAAVCGSTLMLTRGLLESEHVAAVMAHELGHLRGLDARLTAAVNRLVLKPIARPRAAPEEAAQQRTIPGRTIAIVNQKAQNTIVAAGLMRWMAARAISVLRGGFGLRVTAPMWGAVWREQEYAADAWAASIGQGEDLAEFLECHTLMHDHSIPLVGLTDHTQPPTELRIDMLRQGAQGSGARSRGEGLSWMGGPA
jgi:Zn-dependent protease with chaperone function